MKNGIRVTTYDETGAILEAWTGDLSKWKEFSFRVHSQYRVHVIDIQECNVPVDQLLTQQVGWTK